MAMQVLTRRLVALGVCASVGVFTTAMLAGPASAKSKGKSHHTTTTTSKKGKKGKSTKGTSKGSSLTSELKQLETKAKGQKQIAFYAVYSLKGKTSSTKSYTFAQQPPNKSFFKTTSGTIISTGTETLYCSTLTTPVTTTTTTTTPTTPTATTSSSSTSGGPQCLNEGSGSDPMAGLFDLFSGTTAIDFFGEAEQYAAAKEAGVTISYSSGTFAGLSSKCVTITDAGKKEKYCIGNNGLLDYWSVTGTQTATLTKYSTTIPSGTFTPPKGVTITTVPSA
jgi:hypothetical protein